MGRVEPVGGADAVRARRPPIHLVFAETRATVLEGGLVPADLKALCARLLADDPELAGWRRSERFTPRETAALRWTEAIAWDDAQAGDELWGELHARFTEPELVELGYAIAFLLGQNHWLRTLGMAPEIPHAARPSS